MGFEDRCQKRAGDVKTRMHLGVQGLGFSSHKTRNFPLVSDFVTKSTVEFAATFWNGATVCTDKNGNPTLEGGSMAWRRQIIENKALNKSIVETNIGRCRLVITFFHTRPVSLSWC